MTEPPHDNCNPLHENKSDNIVHYLTPYEVEKLLSKGVMEPAQHEQGEILSNIFIRPKTDGTCRLILNLKEFNKRVSYCHFKVDTLNTIINLMSPDCYMASLDLKDAYYSIRVMKEHKIFAFPVQWAALPVHLSPQWIK